MKIGDLAAETGASVRSLRYYEEQQLLTADRTSGGQRVYGDDAAERVRLIRCLHSAGLTSRTIALLLVCETTEHVSTEMIDDVRRQHLQIAQSIQELGEAHAKLGTLLENLNAARSAQE